MESIRVPSRSKRTAGTGRDGDGGIAGMLMVRRLSRQRTSRSRAWTVHAPPSAGAALGVGVAPSSITRDSHVSAASSAARGDDRSASSAVSKRSAPAVLDAATVWRARAAVRRGRGGDDTDAGRRHRMRPGSGEREAGVARGSLSGRMGLDRAHRAGDAGRCGDAAPTFRSSGHLQHDGGICGCLLVAPCRNDLRDPGHRDGGDPAVERRTNARDLGRRWFIVARVRSC